MAVGRHYLHDLQTARVKPMRSMGEATLVTKTRKSVVDHFVIIINKPFTIFTMQSTYDTNEKTPNSNHYKRLSLYLD